MLESGELSEKEIAIVDFIHYISLGYTTRYAYLKATGRVPSEGIISTFLKYSTNEPERKNSR